MTDTQELDNLIVTARARGAAVTVTYDQNAMRLEGRRIYETIQVSEMQGVGPFPMSPISAAETLRAANARALYRSTRQYRRLH